MLALCITSGIHYKWGNAMPLALQSIMIPMNLMDEPLFRIHILGQDAVGKLQRPFKAPDSPFAALMGETPTTSPPAADPRPEEKKRPKREKKNQ